MNGKDEKYKDALLVELIRYMELERKDWDMSDEFDLSLYSVWYLLNPLNLSERSKLMTEYALIREDQFGAYRTHHQFTSHSHHNEPLHPSPDDLIVYRGIRDRLASHYITDRFNLVKIDPKRPYRSYLGLQLPDENGEIHIVIGGEENI